MFALCFPFGGVRVLGFSWSPTKSICFYFISLFFTEVLFKPGDVLMWNFSRRLLVYVFCFVFVFFPILWFFYFLYFPADFSVIFFSGCCLFIIWLMHMKCMWREVCLLGEDLCKFFFSPFFLVSVPMMMNRRFYFCRYIRTRNQRIQSNSCSTIAFAIKKKKAKAVEMALRG